MKRIPGITFFVLLIALTTNCDKDRGINLFTIDQDIEFGEKMDSTINSDPTEYPVLDKSLYPEAYTYINNMMNDILESDKIKYKDEFNWRITLIDKEVMNAFAVPGGSLYFYTGLLGYLDDGASLAGVLGHEMAHVDLRHSTKTMTNVYGFSLLLSILTGDNSSQLAEIASSLATGAASLKFSRDHEYDADKYSMYYLSTTDFHPKGIASFFIKLQDEGQTSETFEFLSTHPSDQNRIDNINNIWESDSYIESNKSDYSYFEQEYKEQFINFLP